MKSDLDRKKNRPLVASPLRPRCGAWVALPSLLSPVNRVAYAGRFILSWRASTASTGGGIPLGQFDPGPGRLDPVWDDRHRRRLRPRQHFFDHSLGGSPTILLEFNSANGRNPYGSLTLSGSTMYGMTMGPGNQGSIFSITTAGSSSFSQLVPTSWWP